VGGGGSVGSDGSAEGAVGAMTGGGGQATMVAEGCRW
jgi:hypothetical protein